MCLFMLCMTFQQNAYGWMSPAQKQSSALLTGRLSDYCASSASFKSLKYRLWEHRGDDFSPLLHNFCSGMDHIIFFLLFSEIGDLRDSKQDKGILDYWDRRGGQRTIEAALRKSDWFHHFLKAKAHSWDELSRTVPANTFFNLQIKRG